MFGLSCFSAKTTFLHLDEVKTTPLLIYNSLRFMSIYSELPNFGNNGFFFFASRRFTVCTSCSILQFEIKCGGTLDWE